VRVVTNVVSVLVSKTNSDTMAHRLVRWAGRRHKQAGVGWIARGQQGSSAGSDRSRAAGCTGRGRPRSPAPDLSWSAGTGDRWAVSVGGDVPDDHDEGDHGHHDEGQA